MHVLTHNFIRVRTSSFPLPSRHGRCLLSFNNTYNEQLFQHQGISENNKQYFQCHSYSGKRLGAHYKLYRLKIDTKMIP
jgi:hypothetical protein